jgi:hypothetical protein
MVSVNQPHALLKFRRTIHGLGIVSVTTYHTVITGPHSFQLAQAFLSPRSLHYLVLKENHLTTSKHIFQSIPRRGFRREPYVSAQIAR